MENDKRGWKELPSLTAENVIHSLCYAMVHRKPIEITVDKRTEILGIVDAMFIEHFRFYRSALAMIPYSRITVIRVPTRSKNATSLYNRIVFRHIEKT